MGPVYRRLDYMIDWRSNLSKNEHMMSLNISKRLIDKCYFQYALMRHLRFHVYIKNWWNRDKYQSTQLTDNVFGQH